jgi:hypothetical protein
MYSHLICCVLSGGLFHFRKDLAYSVVNEDLQLYHDVCLNALPARSGSLRTREIAGRRSGRVDGCFADDFNGGGGGSCCWGRRRLLLLLLRKEVAAAGGGGRVPLLPLDEHRWS